MCKSLMSIKWAVRHPNLPFGLCCARTAKGVSWPTSDATIALFLLHARSEAEKLHSQHVLTSMIVYLAMAIDLPQWAIKAIDKIRSFLWRGRKDAKGGHCLVAPKVCLPIELGGLGISNLQTLSWALRSRWLWLQKMDPTRPWGVFQIHVHKNNQVSSLLQLSLMLEIVQGLFLGLIDGLMVSEWKTLHLKCLSWCPNKESIGQYLKL